MAAKIGLLCAITPITTGTSMEMPNFCHCLNGVWIMTDRVDISRLLSDMRTLKAQTQAFQRPDALRGAEPMANGMRNLGGATVNEATKVPSFGDLMTQAVNKVNDVQKTSSAMADAYERGIAGVDITDVMIASQKASVSFQAMVQVRNKLVEAYKEVMNMPI
jgi:flagellar hook-basal body complex protein FliE